MEASRPASSAKWVSRRTLDSQAHSRDHSAGIQQQQQQHQQAQNAVGGRVVGGNIDSANTSNTNVDRRKFGVSDLNVAAAGGGNIRGGNGNGGGYRTSSGHHFGASNSGHGSNGGWGSITSNPGVGANNKVNHSMVNPAAPLNTFPQQQQQQQQQQQHQHNSTSNSHHHHHPHGSNGNGNGGRRGYGGYGEATEPTMPPPPRSVQMGQGTLPAHAAPRDLIPQPRHAKTGRPAAAAGVGAAPHSNSANTAAPAPRGMDAGNAAGPADSATTRRWTSATSTPTPRSAQSSNSAAAAVAAFAGSPAPASMNGAAVHHDPQLAAPAAAPRSSPSSPFTAASSSDPRSTPVAPPLPPPAPAAGAAAAAAPLRGFGGAPPPPPPQHQQASAPISTPPLPRSFTPAAAAAATARLAQSTSSVEALQLSEHIIFDTHDFDEPPAIQPSEIEALLGQVKRSTAAAVSKAPGEAAMGGSLRERRSVADWGIEEAIKSVLPGMDEDDNDLQGPNLFASGMAVISGSWHTSGEPDTRPSATSGGVGLLADFPTSFAASFSEPVSAVLGSPFLGDPPGCAMDNLSRAFSTAARVDSSSFTTSPATTTAATPLQRPPNSPGLHLPHYTIPDDAVTMPPSTRDVAPLPPPGAFTTHAATAAVAAAAAAGAPTALQRSLLSRDEVAGDSMTGAADLLTLLPHPHPAGTSPWLSSGLGGDAVLGTVPHSRASEGVADHGASKASSGSLERHGETRTPHQGPSKPTRLPSLPIKNSSIDSSGGLTASMNASSPGGPPTRQSTLTASAPNTPSLRREVTTPLSAARSQAYSASGTGRPQRPSLSAPAVNRQTIAQIFRETPQSLLRKEKMAYNHEHHPQALCKDAQWPPRNDAEVDQMLRSRGATKLLRHLTIVSFSRQHVGGVQELFDTWAKNGIPAPDMGFGAYYYYVKEKSEKLLCMKHNGRGPSPGHGYGRCDFESRRPYSTCRYEHVCLFCRSKEHGWFEEGKCQGYQQLLAEMEELGITEEDVVTLLNAMERTAKATWLR